MIEVRSDLIKTSTVSSLDEIGKLFTDYGKVDVRAADGKITIFRDGSWLGEGSYCEGKRVNIIKPGMTMTYDGFLYGLTKDGYWVQDKCTVVIGNKTIVINHLFDDGSFISSFGALTLEEGVWDVWNVWNKRSFFEDYYKATHFVNAVRPGYCTDAFEEKHILLKTKGKKFEWFKVGDKIRFLGNPDIFIIEDLENTLLISDGKDKDSLKAYLFGSDIVVERST